MSKPIQVIMIDNYDSFTYNLVDCFKKLNCNVTVYRNSVPLNYMINMIKEMPRPKCLVISPGPGTPDEAGISLELIKQLYTEIPILGICLGHQSIAQAFGAKIEKDKFPQHGKSSLINYKDSPLFSGLPSVIRVGRYHSLYVNNLPSSLQSIAYYKNINMGISHQYFPIYGIQFHPESILTADGEKILKNFINIVITQGASHAN